MKMFLTFMYLPFIKLILGIVINDFYYINAVMKKRKSGAKYTKIDNGKIRFSKEGILHINGN